MDTDAEKARLWQQLPSTGAVIHAGFASIRFNVVPA